MLVRILLLLFVGHLCSFSLAPPQKKNAQPSIEQKKQKRLQKRHARLLQRFDQAKNSQQQRRLQKKIQQVERQQDSKPSTIWAVLGFSFALLSILIFVLGILGTGRIFAPSTALLFYLLSFIIAILAVVFSAVGLAKGKANPDDVLSKPFGLTGAIIGGIMVGVLLIFILLFILFL